MKTIPLSAYEIDLMHTDIRAFLERIRNRPTIRTHWIQFEDILTFILTRDWEDKIKVNWIKEFLDAFTRRDHFFNKEG